MDLTELKKEFYKKYGEKGNKISIFFSPGRVNLIGEHTDYNGGYVFPCTLSFGTYLITRKTDDNLIKFATTNFNFSINILLNELSQKQGNEWVNYPLGVIDQLIKKGVSLSGLEFLYSGNIPNAAGLSSSASIEMVTAFAINEIFSFGLDIVELAKLSQRAENEFVGMNCGIMDQFAAGMGKKDSALFLNCNTLEYELVPVILKDYELIITNTNKQRTLTDSKYNERRSECEKAVEYLNRALPIQNLSEIGYTQFLDIQSYIPEEIIKRRAKHVISENQRVLDAVKALKNGELVTFGALMNASHDSLRNDYEVTGIELDALVEEARKIDGVIGSRMTGAGFGGCTVSLVKKETVEKFCTIVGKNYEKITGLKADFYLAKIGEGTRRITD